MSAGSIAMPAHTPGPWAWNETGYSLRPPRRPGEGWCRVSAAMPLHPIVMADGRVPCDCCDAVVSQAEAEANFPAWQQMLCDHCAAAYADANPQVQG